MKQRTEPCHFHNKGGICTALDCKCDGLSQSCGFYKTDADFINESDFAILRCRQKELCPRCKYRNKQCLLSSETERKFKFNL